MKLTHTAFLSICALVLGVACSSAQAQHAVLVQAGDKIALVAEDGSLAWEQPSHGSHDIHLLENGNILTVQDGHVVVELDPKTNEAVWSYDASKENGNDGKRVEVHAVQPLPGNHVMIAESGPARIIEINHEGKLQKAFVLSVDNHDAHRDTRLARKLDNGHYLVCHELDGAVREYDADGMVAWSYEVPLFGQERQDGHGPEAFGNQVFSAVRLANGNTLIGTGNGHSVLEVTPKKEIVWELHQNDLPGITLAWVTTLEVLPNGNIVFGNCHAGPGQPQIIEIDPKTKEVVWKFEHFDEFGNDLTNSQLVAFAGKSAR